MKDAVSGGGNDPLDGNGGSFILGFIDMDDKTFEVHQQIRYIFKEMPWAHPCWAESYRVFQNDGINQSVSEHCIL